MGISNSKQVGPCRMGLVRGRTPWIGVSYRSWLTIRPSRKPVISAKDRFPVRRRTWCTGCAAVCPGAWQQPKPRTPALRPRPSANHDTGQVAAMAVSK